MAVDTLVIQPPGAHAYVARMTVARTYRVPIAPPAFVFCHVRKGLLLLSAVTQIPRLANDQSCTVTIRRTGIRDPTLTPLISDE
jgi:hypothetical protein